MIKKIEILQHSECGNLSFHSRKEALHTNHCSIYVIYVLGSRKRSSKSLFV